MDTEKLKSKIISSAAYFSTFYFIEILFMMFGFLIFYGKIAAVISGIFFSMMLAFHVIRLNFRRKYSSLIQVAIMLIHASYSISYFAGIIYTGTSGSYIMIFLVIYRVIMLAYEIPAIYFFADDNGAGTIS